MLRAWRDLRLGCAGIALLAFAVRLTPLLIGGGLGSYGRYDDGVYYAAADALTFGRVPYRDFVLLHPPGITVVLAPFALLGRVTTDQLGMATGRVAFMLIGAANAVLVTVLAARWSRTGAVVAGSLYACWSASSYAEQSTLLEPLGSSALLVALLLLTGDHSPSPWSQWLAGAALGGAVTLKIWYVAPWLAVCAWPLIRRQARAAARVVLGGTAAIVIVTLPFALLARSRMFDMVIRDQLLRPVGSAPRSGRLASIFGIRGVLPGDHVVLALATGAVMAVVTIASVGCLLRSATRILVGVLAVNLVVLLASPSYFGHYAHLTAAPAAVVVGVGGAAVLQRCRRVATSVPAVALVSVVGVVAGVAVVGMGARVASTAQGRPVNGAALARAAPPGCVASDSPELLIQLNRLSRDLRSRCQVLVDVSGITYDSLHRLGPSGRPLPRARNVAWQRYLSDYLLSASSYVLVRGAGEIAPGVYRTLTRRPVLAVSDGVVLRAGR